MDVEQLYIDGVLDSHLIKWDAANQSQADIVKYLKASGYEVPDNTEILKGWYRKVPCRDECNEYCGWMIHPAKPNSRGAFYAALAQL